MQVRTSRSGRHGCFTWLEVASPSDEQRDSADLPVVSAEILRDFFGVLWRTGTRWNAPHARVAQRTNGRENRPAVQGADRAPETSLLMVMETAVLGFLPLLLMHAATGYRTRHDATAIDPHSRHPGSLGILGLSRPLGRGPEPAALSAPATLLQSSRADVQDLGAH